VVLSFSLLGSVSMFALAQDGITGGARKLQARELHEWMGQPNLRPERDFRVVLSENTVVGAAFLIAEPSISRAVGLVYVQRRYRRQRLGSALLKALFEQARRLDLSTFHASAAEDDADTRRWLEQNGLQPVRVYWRIRWSGTVPSPPKLPAGCEFLRLQPGEEKALTDLQNLAFGGSWGFCPNQPEEVAYRLTMQGGKPEDVLMLWRGQLPVGYCWTRLFGDTSEIHMIGVDPATRGLALGRALVCEAIRDLRARGADAVELTVDRQNLPAVRLYESVGFQHRANQIWYERRFSP